MYRPCRFFRSKISHDSPMLILECPAEDFDEKKSSWVAELIMG